MQPVSIQIIGDGISEASEIFFGLLSSADGMVLPSNVHLEPTRATATIMQLKDIGKINHNIAQQLSFAFTCIIYITQRTTAQC